MFVGTWWSLMPPIVAIALALLTKEVYLSLFAGCALGALLAAEFHPWIAFDTLFNTMINSVDFSILMFMILLGMIVMLMQESGGTRAYGEWASSHLKSKRSALVTTSLLGALIFVDDYFNCLTVGSVMRPVTDKYKVSRAKLAYIIDATPRQSASLRRFLPGRQPSTLTFRRAAPCPVLRCSLKPFRSTSMQF